MIGIIGIIFVNSLTKLVIGEQEGSSRLLCMPIVSRYVLSVASAAGN